MYAENDPAAGAVQESLKPAVDTDETIGAVGAHGIVVPVVEICADLPVALYASTDTW